MIGQRREIFFENFRPSEEALEFDLICGEKAIRGVRLPLDQFLISKGKNLGLRLGPKIIHVFGVEPNTFEGPHDCNWDELVHWFTPDRLLFFHSRNLVKTDGLTDFRQFTEFELYYVGISKKGDSFSRLFKTAHEKRSRILGNEKQIKPTARLSDELVIFLFAVEDLQFLTMTAADDDIPVFAPALDTVKLTADAEKAFVRILRSKYNAQTYPSYPVSTDGLWSEKFNSYAFFINEALTFKTPSTEIRGSRLYDSFFRDVPDFIVIENGEVNLVKAARGKY